MNDEDAQKDWEESFDIPTDDAQEVAEEKEVENEPTEPEKGDEEEKSQEPDSKDEEQDEEQGSSDDAKEDSGDAEEDGEPDAEEPSANTPVEEPKLTKEDIKAVLKEVEQEKYSFVDDIKQTKKEVLETFYPQGIDRQLRDKDGDPIKSIEDVMDRINPRTGENFTEEEAGRWLLQEQQALNKQIEELEASAERVAEVNVNLKRDVQRVVDKYGDILTANPTLADKAKALYERTLRKDAKTGITLETPVELLEFYDTFLEPYINGLPQQPPVVEEPPADPPKPKRNPDDRADLPITNNNDNLSKEDKEWQDIAKEYQSMRN
jgi:hypothetical protein